MNGPTASRMNAENVLKDKIRRKESELNALQILQRVIPWDDICEEDEAKLWSYFCNANS